MKRIALISTGVGVVPIVSDSIKRLSPSTEIVNFVDDGVVKAISANGNTLSADIYKRLLYLMYAAELSGAQAILVTCSSISEFVDYAEPFAKLPIYKIDEPMLQKALTMGRNIGIAATAETTLAPTMRQITALAEKQKQEVKLVSRLVAGAFDAFQRGDSALHDGLVRDAVIELCDSCDVVLLAQASMIGALSKLDTRYQDKVLSSPYLGVKRVLNEQE